MRIEQPVEVPIERPLVPGVANMELSDYELFKSVTKNGASLGLDTWDDVKG